MAKILFLSHRVPYPPNKGDKIRSFHEIKHFRKNHEVHLLAFCDDAGELSYVDELKRYCRSVTLIPLRPLRQRMNALLSMIQGKPWTIGYYENPQMRKAVREQLGSTSFDLIFAFSSSIAPYALMAPSIPKVLDFVDSDAMKWRQYAMFKAAPASWLYTYESGKLARFEQDMVRRFDASVFVSAREAGHLTGKIHFIQNGIDLEYFADIQPQRSSNTIIFTGAMNYFPNVDAVTYFAIDIFPMVRSACADAEFLIAGSRPTSSVRQLGNLPGVTVTGTVPDIRPFLAKSKVAVVPMRISQGIQNKILEALAAGLPVVTTPTAAASLDQTSDVPIAIVGKSNSIAGHIIGFLQKSLTEEQISYSRHYLKQRYDWNTNLSVFDSIFREIRS